MNHSSVSSATGPAYWVARTAAASVHEHFARHLQPDGEPIAADLPLPDEQVMEAALDAAFWASLRREEGYVSKLSLALMPPGGGTNAMIFERPLPLTAAGLTRLAPAVERPGIHLGVWRVGDQLSVWGTVQAIPRFCPVFEVVSPGLLVVKRRRGEESGKFVNVAVLEGDDVKVIDERASSLPDCPALLASLVGFDTPTSWADSVNVLVELAVSMRAHGRGGSLLVVPAAHDTWRESIVHPVAYSIAPPFSDLANLMTADTGERRWRRWEEALRRAVEAVAGLTAVDGATVLSDRYDLLAFGAKIGRRDGRPQVERVAVTEPIERSAVKFLHPTEIGGTRHLSAAQFVQDQHDAIALVASQDGRFTIFAWSPCEGIVHAHRVETLLL
jgi:hypothetical protein